MPNVPQFNADETAMLRMIADQPPERAVHMLLALGASFRRTGEDAKFAEVFRRAYCEKAIQDLTGLVSEPGEAYELAQLLVRHGVRYAPVVASLARGAARSGRREDVRSLIDYERFLRSGLCAPPAGETLDSFNDAVAGEIKASLTYYDTPSGRAIRKGWRHNSVLRAATPALMALREMLLSEIARYVAALPDEPEHPFIGGRPARQRVGGWAVVSDAQSHHVSHIHPSAWLTGVYYVTQPDVSRDGASGWLTVGPPPGVDADSGWETRRIEPKRGSFVLMPAYFFHETQPMGVDQERICIAFETQFGELKYLDGLDAD